VEIDKLSRQVARSALEAAAKPGDRSKQEAYAQAAMSLHQANRTLVAFGQGEKSERERVEKERVRQEREREEQERIAREKAKQDEVAAAAQKVADSLKDLKVDNTVWGKLYGTAKGIAALMEQLSRAANANDKRGMIEAARELAVLSGTYVQQAKESAAKCTDPKLRDQILIHSQAAKNWSIQLKVITAVKAASEDEDASSARLQLVKCAKGLAKSTVSTVESVRIAAIRSK